MTGKQQLEYNQKDFTQGISTNDYTSDGGFAPSSNRINPIVTPGVIRATAPELPLDTGVSNSLTGNLIASCNDNNTIPKIRVTLTDAADFGVIDGVTSSAYSSITTGSGSYSAGFSDIVGFGTHFYATQAADLSKLTWAQGSPTLDEAWWTTTKGKSPLTSGGGQLHPLLVYEGFCWVADGSNLHYFDTSEAITINQLQFNSNEIIVALGIDPGTGLMMISVVQNANYSGTIASKYFVYLYDGYAPKPRRKIPVDDLITCFHNVGGIVYCVMGDVLGSWNGAGVTFLRKLAITLAGAQLVYKHHITNIENTLLIAEGEQVLAYGAIKQRSQPVFYYPYKTSVATTAGITMICSLGKRRFAVGYLQTSNSHKRLFYTDLTSTAAGTGVFLLPNVFFPRPVFITKVRVFTTGITAGASGGLMGLIDEVGGTNRVAAYTFADASTWRKSAGTNYVFDFNYANLKLQTMQPRIDLDTQSYGLIRVIIYYDVAE